MSSLHKAALERVTKTLSALGCTYAIIDQNKELHGNPLSVLDDLGTTYAVIDSQGVRHGLVSKVLEKMECQYIITTKDGMKYSNTIDKVDGTIKTKVRQYPHGELRAYVKTFLKDMQVGDIASIPAGKYDLRNIQNSATSWFVTQHGKQSCTTYQNATTKTVEVLRIG